MRPVPHASAYLKPITNRSRHSGHVIATGPDDKPLWLRQAKKEQSR